MNQVALNQGLSMCLEFIKQGALDGVDQALIAELAACAQTLIFGSELEQAEAWDQAQGWMHSIAVERGTAAGVSHEEG